MNESKQPSSPSPLRVPVNASAQELEDAYARGLLRREQLVHGSYYEGRCRNATVARWHAGRGVFVHVRTKFEHRFLEEIRHPADEKRHDVFIATRLLATAEVPEQARVADAAFEAWGGS